MPPRLPHAGTRHSVASPGIGLSCKLLTAWLLVGVLFSSCSQRSTATHSLPDDSREDEVSQASAEPASAPANSDPAPQSPASRTAPEPGESTATIPATPVAEPAPEQDIATTTERADPAAVSDDSPAEHTGDSRFLVPEPELRVEKGPDALRMTFDDIDLLRISGLQQIPPDVLDHMPDWLKSLSGQKVVLRGWMYPPSRQDGLGGFIFVRDNGVCCFGPNAKLYDKIGVKLKTGVTTHFIEGHSFDVTGEFVVSPDLSDPDNSWLYFLNDARIIDKPR